MVLPEMRSFYDLDAETSRGCVIAQSQEKFRNTAMLHGMRRSGAIRSGQTHELRRATTAQLNIPTNKSIPN